MSNRTQYLIYDIETYINLFTVVIKNARTGEVESFEVSERKNDFGYLGAFLDFISRDKKYAMVGFNSLYFDYPVLHVVLKLWRDNPEASAEEVLKVQREKAMEIITGPFEERFKHVIWPKDQFVQQIDLFKIHHFDNVARSTSLKALEFAMRSKDIGDLPYDPNELVPLSGFDEIIKYNIHDVEETFRFFGHTADAMALRKKLSRKFKKDFSNHNDTKIGKDIFVIELERQLGEHICFIYDEIEGRRPRQTPRSHIAINDIIFDYIKFDRPEFQSILEWFKKQTIRSTKGVFSEVPLIQCQEFIEYADTTLKKGKLKAVNVVIGGEKVMVKKGRTMKQEFIGGLPFVFGTGGLHACVDPSTWESDEENVIIDVDVTSYYPSLAIENRFYPEHLGEKFCDIYQGIKTERVKHPKGSPENAAYKLALNGVYGDSNNKHSPFFDPAYTMQTCVNGQLLLCMLSQELLKIRGLKILQVNTDGITSKCPRDQLDLFEHVCEEWQKLTRLTLEEFRYSRMWISDVNNYIGEYEPNKEGEVKVKRKGKFEYKVEWHKNHSMKVVAKAAEAHLLRGESIEEFITNHDDLYDFYLLGKCDRNSSIVLRDESTSETIQRNNRYYASTDGRRMIKIMPPKAKKISKKLMTQFNKLGAKFTDDELSYIEYSLSNLLSFDIESLRKQGCPEEKIAAFNLCQPLPREISMCDSLVTVHNELQHIENINYAFYIKQAQKLVDSVKDGAVIDAEAEDDSE